MSESNPLSGVYESLTKPIRERPWGSLAFFAACFGAGLLLSKWLPLKSELWQQALVTLLFVFPSAGILLSLHRLVVMRNEPSRLKDPAVLDRIRKSFVGREDDAEAFVALVLSSYQVWLNGDSGVGKSVLLQKTVLPALREKGVPVVYLSSLRGDWEEAPALAILAAMNKQQPEGNVLASLSDALATTNGLLIAMDQFDEFQVHHREKFIPSRGQVISRDQLEEGNQLFRILNSAVRERRVRCVFVTRRDVEWGKRVVLFENADEFFLRRLARSTVEAEIRRIITPEAISNIENGWDELLEQICNDLGEDGILPIQMRFAVLGLEELRHNLTRSAYFRIGGVRGLVAAYIESEVRRVAGNQSLSLEIFRLLNLLVGHDSKSTSPLSEEQMLSSTNPDLCDSVRKALNELENRDILQRILSPDGDVLWRLDHDYLAGPVREIARRKLPEQWELKERYERFSTSGPWQRLFRLAGPAGIVRLAWAWNFKGLRFGPAAAWFLYSISAFFTISAVLTYGVFEGIERIQGQTLGPRLFSVFRTNPSSGTSTSEANALLELSHADMPTRQIFLETSLQSGENAKRLSSHDHGIAIALSRFQGDEYRTLFENVVRPALLQPQGEPEIFLAALQIMHRWNGEVFLNTAEVDQVARRLADRMHLATEPTELRVLGDGLDSLKDRIQSPVAEQMASILVERSDLGIRPSPLGVAYAISPDGTTVVFSDAYPDLSSLRNLPPQQNLWVDSGSGSLPRA